MRRCASGDRLERRALEQLHAVAERIAELEAIEARKPLTVDDLETERLEPTAQRMEIVHLEAQVRLRLPSVAPEPPLPPSGW